MEDLHEALANAVELKTGFEPGEPVQGILPRQENVSDDVAEIFRFESHNVRVSGQGSSAAGDRNVDGVLRNARCVLQPVAQVGVAHERAGIAQPAVDVSGDRQLVIAQ